MTKDDFLVAVKLATGIEIKLGYEYYLGDKIGVIRPTEFMIDGIMYEFFNDERLTFEKRILKRTAFASYYQLMECVNDMKEIITDKIHHKWMIRP